MQTKQKLKCGACQKEVKKMNFGYCLSCSQDIDKANLQLAIGQYIPQNYRIGQFIFNFLEWLGQKGYAPSDPNVRMADPFHIEDDRLIEYWFEYLKRRN